MSDFKFSLGQVVEMTKDSPNYYEGVYQVVGRSEYIQEDEENSYYIKHVGGDDMADDWYNESQIKAHES